MSTKTKFYSSEMNGSPVLSGTAGALLAVLDILVNGFGSGSVVSMSITDEVATAVYASGHPFIPDSVGTFAGASVSAVNGEQRILEVTSTTVKFAVPGASNGTITGTITSKVAGAGWTKPFTGSNLASYKISALEGSGFSLRVDDTGNTFARVRGFETMSDVSTGQGPFPTVSQWADPGLWWSKSNSASSAARPWRIVADDRGFYFFVKQGDTAGEFQGNYFGDIISEKSNDPYACVLRANTGSRAGAYGSFGDDLQYSDASASYNGLFIARAANAIGGAREMYSGNLFAPNLPLAHTSGAYGSPYPSPVNNGLLLSKVAVWNAQGLRGLMPGLLMSPQLVNGSFATDDLVDGTGVLAGAKLRTIRMGQNGTTQQSGILFLDALRDWR